jgi:hypothetical protein
MSGPTTGGAAERAVVETVTVTATGVNPSVGVAGFGDTEQLAAMGAPVQAN